MQCREPRIIDVALLAMSTGKATIDESLYLTADRQDHQKHFLAALTSSNILLHNIRRTSGQHLQLMLGELLARQRLTRDFRDLCSALNLAPSRNYMLKGRASAVLKQIMRRVNVGARDLALLFFDNVGFKVLGRQASYNQWILINIVIVPESSLKAAGFYKDDEPDNQRISRKPTHVWEDVIKNISANESVELSTFTEHCWYSRSRLSVPIPMCYGENVVCS